MGSKQPGPRFMKTEVSKILKQKSAPYKLMIPKGHKISAQNLILSRASTERQRLDHRYPSYFVLQRQSWPDCLGTRILLPVTE